MTVDFNVPINYNCCVAVYLWRLPWLSKKIFPKDYGVSQRPLDILNWKQEWHCQKVRVLPNQSLMTKVEQVKGRLQRKLFAYGLLMYASKMCEWEGKQLERKLWSL